MAGSILSAWVDGVTYNVMADADVNINPGKEIEDLRHSGGTTPKVTNVAEPADEIPFLASKEDRQTLNAINGVKGKSMGFKEQDGTVYNCTGYIKLGTYTTATQTLPVTMVPENPTGWEIT